MSSQIMPVSAGMCAGMYFGAPLALPSNFTRFAMHSPVVSEAKREFGLIPSSDQLH